MIARLSENGAIAGSRLPRTGHNPRGSGPATVPAMRYCEPQPPSILPLLSRWRSTLPEEPGELVQALRVEAARCFRLAQGIASFELADELQAIGRAFAREAASLSTEPARDWDPAGELLAAE